jgi:hypothetical protein
MDTLVDKVGSGKIRREIRSRWEEGELERVAESSRWVRWGGSRGEELGMELMGAVAVEDGVSWEGEVEVWVVEGGTELRRSLGLDLTRLLEEETSFDIPDGTLT